MCERLELRVRADEEMALGRREGALEADQARAALETELTEDKHAHPIERPMGWPHRGRRLPPSTKARVKLRAFRGSARTPERLTPRRSVAE